MSRSSSSNLPHPTTSLQESVAVLDLCRHLLRFGYREACFFMLSLIRLRLGTAIIFTTLYQLPRSTAEKWFSLSRAFPTRKAANRTLHRCSLHGLYRSVFRDQSLNLQSLLFCIGSLGKEPKREGGWEGRGGPAHIGERRGLILGFLLMTGHDFVTTGL